MFYLIFLFSLLNYVSVAEPYNNILDVKDFVKSVTDGNEVAIKYLKQNPENFKFFQEQYELKKPSKMPYSEKPLIPKVMHHIWDGDLTPLYAHYLNECKVLHPDWEFKIWGAKDIADLKLEYQNLYDKARNYPGRSDIARYEILYRFGGVYRDIDVKCLRPIDDLNHKYDFFAPIEFPMTDWQGVLNNGIIAARPKHPILKSTLDVISKNSEQYWEEFDQGNAKIDLYQNIVAKVSMLPLTDGFKQQSQSGDKSVALPASYFWGLGQVKYHSFFTGLRYMISKDSSEVISAFNSIKPETLMNHNYSKQEIFVSNFDYATNMHDPQLKRFFRSLSKADQRIIKSFKQAYDSVKPSYVNWNKKNKIPEVLYFLVFDDKEKEKLEENLPNWKVLNADLEIQIWDKKRLGDNFKELDISIPKDLEECFRFFVGLKILEKFGGNYADFRAYPRKPLFELSNKYNFYAGLMPLTKLNSQVLFSQKLIGASPNHPIISKTLATTDLKDLSLLEEINAKLVRQAHTNLYLYDEVSARNIILPAVYFEPLAKLEKDSFWDRAYRFIFRIPRAFSKLTDFVVVE
ncbi:hypothetical protein phytr_4670 [Candidatus Phycorickettsia trachydisci]|uniref:Uncharacterized protein n=1 Tax=Candidatus Phycorickettsia trachydisci TaxID=2115978 RepID=A0A2P1P830_9RICK|nr:glycosyltransferase [Candidatus Phycorickettsia trachydisci]AVP87416.1 hypothetical protein phytr_4670 [Candidatus Phycorickettsia trachydisci]